MSARNMAKRTAAGTLALAVCLGGGAIALASAASADANFKFDQRIQGDDRYGTAIAASKAAFDKADNVILVNGYATVDGLTASYLAGVANAPILYVSDKGADDATKAEIKRLGAKNIWLVGGTTVIPTSVETAIKGDGYNVQRINGSDRYETAAMIAEAGIKLNGGKKPSKVFVASGTSFADALAVSPVAFVKGYPVILTDKDSTSDFSKKELGNIGTDNKILVGGEAVVSKKVQADLSIKDEQRVAGADRAVTANLVSDWAKKSEGFNPANAALVGGTNGNGADSLVAAPLLGKSFTTLHFAGWDATATYMKDHSAELTGKGFVFGGKAAVSDGQVSAAQSAAQSAAAVSAFIVTELPEANKVNYADTVQNKIVTVSYNASDVYVVDGKPATYASFSTQLSKGDTLSVTKDSAGKSTFTLTNVKSTDYTKGLITDFTKPATLATSVTVGEALSGVGLNTITLGGTYQIYTVDGASVSQAVFTQALNKGDFVEVKGSGADVSNVQTVALTNAKLAGTLSGLSGSTFKIKPAVGAAVGDFTAAASGDTLTVDGKAVAQADFNKALSNGDSVSFSYTGGVQTITLVNAAPNVSTGQAKLSGGAAATQSNGILTALHYIETDGSAADVTLGAALAAGDVNASGDGAADGNGTNAAEKQAFDLGATFRTAPHASLRVVFDSTTVGPIPGNTVWDLSLPAPSSTDTDTTYAAAVKASLDTQIQAKGSSTFFTGASTAVSSSGVVVITYGGFLDATDPTAAVVYNGQPKMFLDGRSAVASEIVNSLTVGDVVKYQSADDSTKTTSMLDVTSTVFGGVVKGYTGTTVTIAGTDGKTTLGTANVDASGTVATTYVGGDTALTGTATFIVNGETKDVTAMQNALSAIDSKTLAGSLTIKVDGTKLVYSLTTKLA